MSGLSQDAVRLGFYFTAIASRRLENLGFVYGSVHIDRLLRAPVLEASRNNFDVSVRPTAATQLVNHPQYMIWDSVLSGPGCPVIVGLFITENETLARETGSRIYILLAELLKDVGINCYDSRESLGDCPDYLDIKRVHDERPLSRVSLERQGKKLILRFRLYAVTLEQLALLPYHPDVAPVQLLVVCKSGCCHEKLIGNISSIRNVRFEVVDKHEGSKEANKIPLTLTCTGDKSYLTSTNIPISELPYTIKHQAAAETWDFANYILDALRSSFMR